MLRTVARLALVAACALAPGAVRGQEHGASCTAGRMFVSDLENARMHVLELDGVTESTPTPPVVGTFDVEAPGMAVYHTGTALDRVVAVFGGTSETLWRGKMQIFRSGITTDNHGDHVDIVKNSPGKYSFEFAGYKPAHFTSSAGFLTAFYDGVYDTANSDGSAPASAQPSAAQFVPESVFTEDSLVVTPTPVTITLAGVGAHHGVAYALSSQAFLVSRATEAREAWVGGAQSTPNGFQVYNANGVMMQSINDVTDANKNCSAAHGSAHVGGTFAFGCTNDGILTVSIDAGNGAITSRKVPFPRTADGFRASTLVSQETNGLFVSNYGDAKVAPAYLMSLSASTLATPTEAALLEIATPTAKQCAFAVDQSTHPATSGTSIVAYLAIDGKLYVTPVLATGVSAGETASAQVTPPTTIVCADYALVAGYGTMYVLDKKNSRMFGVSLAAVLEGRTDEAVTTYSLSFKPAAGTVALPHGLDCAFEEHDHDHHTPAGVDNDSSERARLSAASVVTVLLATLAAALFA